MDNKSKNVSKIALAILGGILVGALLGTYIFCVATHTSSLNFSDPPKKHRLFLFPPVRLLLPVIRLHNRPQRQSPLRQPLQLPVLLANYISPTNPNMWNAMMLKYGLKK